MSDEVEIKVDTSKMTFKDLKFLLAYSSKQKNAGEGDAPEEAVGVSPEDMPRMLSLLDNVVVGGIDDLPVSRMGEIAEAVASALSADNTRKN